MTARNVDSRLLVYEYKVIIKCFNLIPSAQSSGPIFGSKASYSALDARVDALGHPLQRQPALDVLHHPRHRGLDALDVALGVGDEEVNVLLPSWRPLCGLVGETLLGAGHHHVERCENANAGGGDDEDLGGSGLGETGDARHDGGCVWWSEGDVLDESGVGCVV